MNGSAKICMIVYGKLRELAKRTLSDPKYADGSIWLVDGAVDQLHHIVDKAVEQGCEVFIAGSANAAELRRYSGAPLIELRLRPIDYAIALRKALQLGEHPALVIYKFISVVHREELSFLLGREIELIDYETTEELLEKLHASKADVIVGASQAIEAAERLKKPSVFVYPGDEVILDAIRRARAMVQALERERRNSELMQAVISESKTGIVGFSEKREVLMINAAAQQMMSITTAQAQRSRLRDLVSDEEYHSFLGNEKKSVFLIKRVRSRSLQMQLMKMERSGRNLGTLLMIEEISKDGLPVEKPSEVVLSSIATFKDMVTRSAEMKRVMTQAKALPKGSPLIITGEHGVGKALLAQCIHSFHNAQFGDYIVLNCATVPVGNEAALFYDTGTGGGGEAKGQRIIDLFAVGTLVLENIWDASERLQACLVWAIDGMSECFSRNGVKESNHLSVITLIPSDRWQLCRDQLRQDLLHRLQVSSIMMPPLRKRAEDVTELFAREILLASDNSRIRPNKVGDLSAVLTGYSWGGNVNELNSVCRRYLVQKASAGKLNSAGEKRLLIQCIGESRLLEDILKRHLGEEPPSALDGGQLLVLVQDLKEILLYSNEQIAEKLGVSRTSIWRKLKQDEKKLKGSVSQVD